MASFPSQEWCEPYSWQDALKNGTIFPCMNLEFYRAEKPEQSCAESPLNEISAISFALNDLTLYLDTHPECAEGMALFKKLLQKRLELLADYAGKHYPLTQFSMMTGTPEVSKYSWAEGPAPWEGGLV